MRKPILIYCLLFCIIPTLFAQNRYTISGFVRDSLTSENLIAASIYNRINQAGTATNDFGFYSLTLTGGTVDIIYAYVGYVPQVKTFQLSKDTVINIGLSGITMLQEAVVTAKISEGIQDKTQMSTFNVPITQIKALPAFLGEVDLMKVLQLMPGVQSGSEGSSGLYVRGGGPDQNLILLDGVPVYNASHLFGFFSVFNADAINNVELMKGGFPARYGGRTSSVVDINMKEGNANKFHGEGAIGLISAKLTLEGPIIKDKTSFIVSARRTYIDVLAQPFIKQMNEDQDEQVNTGYFFYDLTAKINHRFSDRDRIYLSAYMGADKFHLEDDYQSSSSQFYMYDTHSKSRIEWGNITSALRWNHVFTKQLFGNTTATYSRFRFNTGYSWLENQYNNQQKTSGAYQMDYNSSIEDWSGKIAFDYVPSPDHYIRFGGSVINHLFEPGVTTFSETTMVIDTTLGASRLYTNEFDMYAEDDFLITDRLKINAGLHWSGFSVRNDFYQYLQPRIAARYLINNKLSAKASYSRMAQYVHLLTNSGVSLPTDLWVPTTDVLKPQLSDQIAFGLVHNFNATYEASIEAYYKTMDNVLEYREGASFFNLDGHWENKILQGKGESYGIELFGQKKMGKLTGWIGYTLSWTNRKFDLLNGGKTFPYKYDRRHDVSVVAIYQPGKKIELSGTWVFGTGNAITIPTATFWGRNPFMPVNVFTEAKSYVGRNDYRMAPYHRLDLGISFIRQTRWGESRWILGLYNTYNRQNPFYIDVDTKSVYNPSTGQEIKKHKFVQYSLFPVIPSVSYHFKF